MTPIVELEREDDGRWLAKVPAIPGVLTYGNSRRAALARVQALALRVLGERLEHGEKALEFINTQGATLAEARGNLSLVLGANRTLIKELHSTAAIIPNPMDCVR